MSYIKFDKSQLVNLGYSLRKEMIRSNRIGAYANTTIINCNTRKYHGLLVIPQPGVDDGMHVLISSFDETIIQHGEEFNLGIHQYDTYIYNPKGHKYFRDFTSEPIPKLTYQVGGVVIEKEMVFSTKDDKFLLKYTLVDAHSPTRIKFKPFLAFRNIHALTHANYDADTKYTPVPNGISMKLYPGYSDVFIQFSKKVEYTHVPDWYHNIEYIHEKERGYDYKEDLFVPGFFELDIKKGESIYVVMGTENVKPSSLQKMYEDEVTDRIPRNSFENCLLNSALQFVVKRGDRTIILAGYPWFGRVGRDTFVVLPGLTLAQNDIKTFTNVIDTIVKEMKGPFFPNSGEGNQTTYNSADAPLWFFWSLQKLVEHTGDHKSIWKKYGPVMKLILSEYRKGTDYGIKMQPDGLLASGVPGVPVTWMDAVVNGQPVTPRIGLAVEVNSLWYNAIRFALELAEKSGDKEFITEWKEVPLLFEKAFVETFWDTTRGYLFDYVNGTFRDFSVRPNQIFAVSLPYTVLTIDQQQKVVEKVRSELLTPRGVRTLAPKNPRYKGSYSGNVSERDTAYHNGCAFPWLLGHYFEAYHRIYGPSSIPVIKKYYKDFEKELSDYGIGTINELFDGDPPHTPGGAISQAWSVSELLRIASLLRKYDETK